MAGSAAAVVQLPASFEKEGLFFQGPEAFFNGSENSDSILDFGLVTPGFLANLTEQGEPKSPLPLRTLLPSNYQWKTGDKQRIPVALCEFAAYKAALAYAKWDVIKANIGNATNATFFDTNPGRESKTDPKLNSKSKGVTDTQGYEYAGFIIASIVAFFIIVFLLIFVRYKLRSHAISERYALYLSTLSYQKIRSLRAAAPEPAEARLKIANDELKRYVRFIRGDVRPEATYFTDPKMANMAELPVPLELSYDLKIFLSEPKNII